MLGRGNEARALGLSGDTSTRRLRASQWISLMLAFKIIGAVFVLLFLAAAMTGIEGTEHR
jgi:hypothetical protein